MKNSIAISLFLFLLILASVSSPMAQDHELSDEELTRILNELASQPLDEREIYDMAIRSVAWIRTTKGQASGVLISKKLQLIVTNAHVTDKSERVDVYFPARNRQGTLISDRKFYLNQENTGVLKELGYYTSGRVVAENSEMDLAIVSLDAVPETSRPVTYEHNSGTDLGLNSEDSVNILGNPAALDLWRWTAGRFQKVVHEDKINLLHIRADTLPGNSGGPVLNSRGRLIGIVALSDSLMDTVAVPVNYVIELLSELELRHIFSIVNETSLNVPYQVKWTEDAVWKQQKPLEPGQGWIHWYTGVPSEITTGYPQVRFDHIAGDRIATFKAYTLETYSRYFGPDIEKRIRRDMDAREYHLGYNPRTKMITLYDSEK